MRFGKFGASLRIFCAFIFIVSDPFNDDDVDNSKQFQALIALKHFFPLKILALKSFSW